MVPYAMHSITSDSAASGGSVPSVTAGSGLTSTTDVDGGVTLNVGAGAGLTVGADAVAIKAGGVTNAMLAAGAVTDAKITGPISVAKGGTGSATKNFVDLSTSQTVGGTKTFSGQIKSSVATGTAPLQVASTTMVNNLNADMLGGMHKAQLIAAAKDEVRTQISACGTTISTPGSYYVTQNLSTTGTCITVTSNDVTIDLMGLSLTGGGAASTYGVYINSVANVEIRNGTIRGFSRGIYSLYTSGSGMGIRVISVRAMANAVGIDLGSFNNLVKDCIAADSTTGNGISVGYSSVVIGSTAYNNKLMGISAGSGSTVTGNTAYSNQEIGIEASAGSTVADNSASSNLWSGIYAGIGSTVSGNSTYSNQRHGIEASTGTTVTRNTAFGNQWSGIYGGAGATITNNASYNNSQNGIYAYVGSKISGNTVYTNNVSNSASYAGIYVNSRSIVKDNTVSANMQNNIYIYGSKSSIEENLTTQSTNGILFSADGNFYANNRASGNTTNYNLGATTQANGGGNYSF